MAWNQQPPSYNPAYSQAGPGGYGQPYNPGAMGVAQAVPPGGGYYQGRPQYSSQAAHSRSLPPGHPPAGIPPGTDPELFQWFQSVDADRSGKITAMELREALLNSNWSHFNPETCRLLIGMFDRNRDGAIDIYEFSALWTYVQEWKGCFDSFDKDRSGNIDASELQQALNSFGYRLSMDFCSLCTRAFDRTDQRTMKFDDFIQCCVMLRSLTESFKKADTNMSGIVTISYEQFLHMAIDNTPA